MSLNSTKPYVPKPNSNILEVIYTTDKCPLALATAVILGFVDRFEFPSHPNALFAL